MFSLYKLLILTVMLLGLRVQLSRNKSCPNQLYEECDAAVKVQPDSYVVHLSLQRTEDPFQRGCPPRWDLSFWIEAGQHWAVKVVFL